MTPAAVRSPARRFARLALMAILPLGCDLDGTVNNEAVAVAATLRMSISEEGLEPIDQIVQFDLSGDGRRVVFLTYTVGMHPEITDANGHIVVRDASSRRLELVDRRTGISGVKAADAAEPRISADGRRVVFSTYSALDPVDSDSFRDVYVRDLVTHETILVSRASGPAGVKSNRESMEPDISADGRFVVFSSIATNLAADDGDTIQDIFLRDLEKNVTELVSRATGAGKSNAGCAMPRVAAGGNRIAFLSDATSLEAGTGGVRHAYVRDRSAGTTTLVSRAGGVAGAIGNGYCYGIDLSDDGRVACFASISNNLHPNDVDNYEDIYLRDVDAAATEHISRGSGVDGKDAFDRCLAPAISGDGRFVTYYAASSNLVKNDENLSEDIFVRDRVMNVTFRGSLRTFGGEANGHSRGSALSSDGRYLAFCSLATNLVEGDGNGVQDLFLRGPLR
jgi:Tol biopolymer transport system component